MTHQERKEDKVVSLDQLDFLPDPDAIEQRPLAGITRGVLYGLSAVLFSFLLWATLSEIDEIVSASGKLITVQPNILVQPLETSIVQSIEVRVGQVVKKGDRLASLDPTFASADESQLRGGLSSLDARATRLEGELTRSPSSRTTPRGNDDDLLQNELRSVREANYRARLLAFDENLAKLDASLKANGHDQKMLEDRVKSLAEIEQMQERLVSQNFGARRSLLEAREKKQEVERDLQMARSREVEIKKEIAASRAERTAFEKDWRQRTVEELVSVRRERDSTAEQLQKAEKRRSMVSLTAPEDGVVLEVAKKSVGSIIREAEPLITLVPLDVPIEAEVRIDASDIGFVRVGNPVRIKLDAYPFQKYGALQGKVQILTQDAFISDQAQPQPAGKRSGGAYYLARVSLETTRLDNVGDDFRLLPGLSLSGEIKVGERSVISYFLYPIIRTMDESLKEPR